MRAEFYVVLFYLSESIGPIDIGGVLLSEPIGVDCSIAEGGI